MGNFPTVGYFDVAQTSVCELPGDGVSTGSGSDRVSTICVSRWDKEAPLEESHETSLSHSLTRMVLTRSLTRMVLTRSLTRMVLTRSLPLPVLTSC